MDIPATCRRKATTGNDPRENVLSRPDGQQLVEIPYLERGRKSRVSSFAGVVGAAICAMAASNAAARGFAAASSV
jgi:hypothetical protein